MARITMKLIQINHKIKNLNRDVNLFPSTRSVRYRFVSSAWASLLDMLGYENDVVSRHIR